MIPLERLEGCWTVFRWLFWSGLLVYVLLLLLPTQCGTGFTDPPKAAAKNDLLQTITAIEGFRLEYGCYPLQTSSDSDLLINHRNQRDLYNILRGLEQQANPDATKIQNSRGVIFFEGKPARKEAKPRGGFAVDGTLYDRWGGVYQFVLDTNGDGKVTIPPEWNQPDSGEVIARPVIGYSPGKTGSPKDDVTTW